MKGTRRSRLIRACSGAATPDLLRAQVRAVERLRADAILAGGGLLLGRWRMPA